ncbi:MAG TPA: DUF502 domain-containing protein [Chlamydiales bacterium]|nr:DUF502 domain-containing protein [Chlamydiales bacterium]
MGKIFFRGLMAIIPMAVTLVLFIWILSALEKTFKVPIQAIIGPQYYFPGLGILVALVLIFIIGSIINNWLIQKLYAFGERIFRKIPIIKTLYNSVSDIMGFFGTGKKKHLGYVVVVKLHGMKALGFVTRETFEDLPKEVALEDEVAVFIPFSYQIGGYTYLIPRSKIEKIDMTIEQAMRFSLSAGILTEKTEK